MVDVILGLGWALVTSPGVLALAGIRMSMPREFGLVATISLAGAAAGQPRVLPHGVERGDVVGMVVAGHDGLGMVSRGYPIVDRL